MDDISKLVLAVLSSSALAAIIAGFFQRRKLGADATEVITKAAASMVDTMQKRLDDQEETITEQGAELKALRKEIGELKDKDRENQAFKRSANVRAQRHAEWDRKMAKVVRDLDPSVQIEDPPPIYPEA